MFEFRNFKRADGPDRDIFDHAGVIDEPYAVCSSCGSIEVFPADSCSTCWKDTLVVTGTKPTTH